MIREIPFVVLVACALLAGLMLGVHPAVGQTVEFGDGGTKATAIRELSVGGVLYDVTFAPSDAALDVYGPFPGMYTFATATEAEAAVDVVLVALNDAGARSVGEVGNPVDPTIFNIGYEGVDGDVQIVYVWRGWYDSGGWSGLGQNQWSYLLDEKCYAIFDATVPVAPTTWGVLKSLYR